MQRFQAWLGEDVPIEFVEQYWDTTLNARFDQRCDAAVLKLSSGERGCAASHLELWRRCVRNGKPLLVLEDDAELTGGCAARLQTLVAALELALKPEERTVLLYLGGHVGCWCTPSGDVKRAQKVVEAFAECQDSQGYGTVSVREVEWMWQTHAYVIWPAAAAVLLTGIPIDAPVDVFLSRHFHTGALAALIVEPALASQASAYGDGDVEHSSLRAKEVAAAEQVAAEKQAAGAVKASTAVYPTLRAGKPAAAVAAPSPVNPSSHEPPQRSVMHGRTQRICSWRPALRRAADLAPLVRGGEPETRLCIALLVRGIPTNVLRSFARYHSHIGFGCIHMYLDAPAEEEVAA